MNLSANTLFHFTRSKENIISILINDFYPRYCMENIGFSYQNKYHGLTPTEIAIPMVSFCDIRLSQIGNHVEKYGSYAIGLSIDWGVKNGLNPILYEVPESNTISVLQNCSSSLLRHNMGLYLEESEENAKLNDLSKEIRFLVNYMKPYCGKDWDLKSEGFNGEVIRFYDEREWRYVPDYYEMSKKSVKAFLPKHEYLRDRDHFNNMISEHKEFRLNFTPKDIKYIIVEKEDEVGQMIKDIKLIKRYYSQDETDLLITKIISVDRIKEDF